MTLWNPYTIAPGVSRLERPLYLAYQYLQSALETSTDKKSSGESSPATAANSRES